MSPFRRLALMSLAASIAAAAIASNAWAITGPSSDGQAFADRVVMILTRGSAGAGFCSGVVLTPRVVLTAAHCLHPAADMLVHFRDAEGKPIVLAVEATAAHPLYRADAVKRRVVSIDVGLVEVRTALPTPFRPVKLGEGEAPPVGSGETAVGYGIAREGDASSGGALRTAALQVREPASKILMWADDPDNSGAGGCSGDSGGPIFAADQETVVAVVAWTSGVRGRRCGALTQGPLIAPLRSWIDEMLTRWGP